MKGTKFYHYMSTDGRYIVSTSRLNYAASKSSNCIDLSVLTEKDLSSVSIFANPVSDLLLRELTETPAEWLPATNLLQMPWTERVGTSMFRNGCILHDGVIYVTNGEYVPLDTYVKDASKEELVQMLYTVAIQAALAQHELSLGHRNNQ